MTDSHTNQEASVEGEEEVTPTGVTSATRVAPPVMEGNDDATSSVPMESAEQPHTVVRKDGEPGASAGTGGSRLTPELDSLPDFSGCLAGVTIQEEEMLSDGRPALAADQMSVRSEVSGISVAAKRVRTGTPPSPPSEGDISEDNAPFESRLKKKRG